MDVSRYKIRGISQVHRHENKGNELMMTNSLKTDCVHLVIENPTPASHEKKRLEKVTKDNVHNIKHGTERRDRTIVGHQLSRMHGGGFRFQPRLNDGRGAQRGTVD